MEEEVIVMPNGMLMRVREAPPSQCVTLYETTTEEFNGARMVIQSARLVPRPEPAAAPAQNTLQTGKAEA